MKRNIWFAAAALLLLLLLPFPALAAEGGVTFYPSACTKDGKDRDFAGEYLVFNQDGTGMAVYAGCAYDMTWTADGNSIQFTDSKGSSFSGTAGGDILQGSYRGCDYSFFAGPDAPVTALSPETWGSGLPPVTDQAGLLSGEERSALSARAKEISERYGCGVYIVTVEDMAGFSFRDLVAVRDGAGGFSVERRGRRDHLGNNAIETLAEEIRSGYSLGCGGDHNCVLLLLSLADRDYDLAVYGGFGRASFTAYGRQVVQDSFLDDFKDDDWADGFEDYLDSCAKLLQLSADGTPLDTGSRRESGVLGALAASLLLGALLSIILCAILRGRMKSANEKTEAAGYIPGDGVRITCRHDRYAHSTETRVYDPPAKSSSGGSSGSSSGHSHSSGKF